MPQSLFQDWKGEPRTYTRPCVIEGPGAYLWSTISSHFFHIDIILLQLQQDAGAFTQPAGVISCSISAIQSSNVVWHTFLNGFFHDTIGALMYFCNCRRASLPPFIEWHLYVSKTRSLSAKDRWPKISCIPFICRRTRLAMKFAPHTENKAYHTIN